MVPPDHAVAHRTNEEDRPFAPPAPRADPQLLPGSKAHFQRGGGGPEQQGQSHHEKILRFPYLPGPRTCSLPLTWQAARAGINPRFLLTNPQLKGPGGLCGTSGRATTCLRTTFFAEPAHDPQSGESGACLERIASATELL